MKRNDNELPKPHRKTWRRFRFCKFEEPVHKSKRQPGHSTCGKRRWRCIRDLAGATHHLWRRPMNALILAMALICGPPQAAALSGHMEVDEHEPIVIAATVEIPDGWSPLYDWDADKPARIREIDNGRTIHVWAPPGKYEVELSVIMAKAGGLTGAIEFKKETSVTVLTVRGTSPTPDPDDDDVNPTGRVSTVLILRDTRTDTAEETRAILKLRTHDLFARPPPELLVLDHDQEAANGQLDPLAAKFGRLRSAGAGFPYFFLLDAKEKVIQHGEVGTDTDAFLAIVRSRSR